MNTLLEQAVRNALQKTIIELRQTQGCFADKTFWENQIEHITTVIERQMATSEEWGK